MKQTQWFELPFDVLRKGTLNPAFMQKMQAFEAKAAQQKEKPNTAFFTCNRLWPNYGIAIVIAEHCAWGRRQP